jgi:hypothetical protein
MREPLVWRNRFRVEKFHADTALEIVAFSIQPYEIIEDEGNLLMYGGAATVWDLVLGGEFGAGANAAPFNNANSFLGVGNSSTAEDATTNDLIGASKLREIMDATYPLNPGTAWTSGASADPVNATVVFKSSYESADANFEWLEFGLFNDASAGQMLFRRVYSFGTKASGDVWTLQSTLGLS